MKKKSLIIIVSTFTLLLLIPFIAMQFTDEVKWTLFDFIVAAVLLVGAGLTIDLIIRKVKRTNYRIVLSLAVLSILLLLWLELAVGVLETLLSGN